MSQQSLRQQSVRDVTGTALDYNSDWMALFDQAGIAAGDFNGRMLAWVNLRLGANYTSLPAAQQAYAEANGAYNFSSLGTHVPVSAFATGTLSFNGNVGVGETVLIGATVYTFVNALVAAYDVLIGVTASITINNLIAAITAGAGEGTVYGTGTLVHPDVTASASPGVMIATAKVAGAAGNSIATQSSAPNATWGAATLQGGT